MTKQVQLSEAAYKRLKEAKQEGESFSDVVLRAVPEKKDWRKFIGTSSSPLTMEERLALAEWMRGHDENYTLPQIRRIQAKLAAARARQERPDARP